MFRPGPAESGRVYRVAIAGLTTLSVSALVVTIWIMNDLLREQETVAELIEYLPPEGDAIAQQLVGKLRWQFRLSILVVINVIVTGCTVLLLWRAYRSSQQSLRAIKALAGDILGSMDQAVITTDVSGLITSMNRRALKLFAVSDDYVGRPLSELSSQLALEEFRRQTRTLESPDQVWDFQLQTNGAHRTLRVYCQPLHDFEQADKGNVLQIRDITERALIKARMQRMERYMGLGSLAAGLHHEIKNPLAALSLHVQLLEEALMEGDSSDTFPEMLGVIKTEVARVGDVLEGFRDFAAVDQLNLAEVDLTELIDRQVKLMGPQAETQGIEIRVKLPTERLPSVHVDRVRLEQVLMNLIINAMEAMPRGGTIEILVSASHGQKPNSVTIRISDSGPGVPENLQSRIFDPYFTTKSGGTGMGLALCDKIVRQHHGSLDYHTTEHGSAFEITLPIK